MNSEEIAERLIALEVRITHFEETCTACRRSEFNAFDNLRSAIHDLDKRLRTVEQRVAFYAGGAALIGTLGGTIVSLLLK